MTADSSPSRRSSALASRLSRGEAAYLLALLVAGVACYNGGWFLASPRAPWRARWRRKDGADA